MKTYKVCHALTCLVVMLLFLLITTALSAPPQPDALQQMVEGKKEIPYYLEHIDEIHQKGICQPERLLITKGSQGGRLLSSTPTPFRVLAILVKFSDHNSSVSATFFDSLVFSANGSTVRNYFSEISYLQIDLVTVNLPSSLGWLTAPQTYTYYVNGTNGIGSYPNNTQKLVEDMVDQIDPLVNFSQYDNNGDGKVDCLLLIHSGTGAEVSFNNNDIWSHKWAISPRLKDGVLISSYTVQPEFWYNPGDMTIGVYSHELGHGFGLPDLYDTDQSSKGVGKWCLMSYGCWNGPSGLGSSPSHPCAWSRIEMGFASSINVTSNTNNVAIDNVEENGTIYRLWTSGNTGNEYFLIENRQKTGSDSYIPRAGLLIWHIDDLKTSNTQEWYPGQLNSNHYKVALEQADDSFDLEHNRDQGDGYDVFPGLGNNTSFDAVSLPNSDSYLNGISFVGVQNISAVGDVINANLVVGFSAGIGDESTLPNAYELQQNFPNPFNPRTTIGFTLPKSSRVQLEIFNLKGELTAMLVDDKFSAGSYAIVWDGRDRSGDNAASGIYFYRLVTDEGALSKKMLLIK